MSKSTTLVLPEPACRALLGRRRGVSRKGGGERTRVRRGTPMTSNPPPTAPSVVQSQGGVSRTDGRWTLEVPGLGCCPVWSAMCLTGRRLASSHSEAAWLAQEVSLSLCCLAFSPTLPLLIPSASAGSAGVLWAAARRRIQRGGLCDASPPVVWPALLEMPHRWFCVTVPLPPHRHTLRVLR